MDNRLERDLRRLFRLVDRPFPGVPDPNTGDFWRLVGADSGALLIEGDAERLVEKLRSAVAGHALDGGPHPDTVDRWIIDACVQARDEGPQAALETFDVHLSSSPRDWRIVAPCPDVALPNGHTMLEVAGCQILPHLPGDLDLNGRWDIATRGLEGQVFTTRIEARDQESARELAYDRFDTARALLAAATGSNFRPRPDTLLVHDDGGWWGGGKHRVLLLPWPRLNPPDSERVWADGWHQLSEAAAAGVRTEWAERVVNACRWLYRSRQSWWTSERIASCFFALEALILPEGQRDKAQKLSARISNRWTLAGFTKETMRTWLKNLYLDERTHAVHLGRDVRRDLDARRLEDLTRYLVWWGVWHLGEFHRAAGSCDAIDDVFKGAHVE